MQVKNAILKQLLTSWAFTNFYGLLILNRSSHDVGFLNIVELLIPQSKQICPETHLIRLTICLKDPISVIIHPHPKLKLKQKPLMFVYLCSTNFSPLYLLYNKATLFLKFAGDDGRSSR